MTYFKPCEHHLFENNCEKLRKILISNFNIFKFKNPLELNELTIKINSFKNELWWIKEDRKLLFLRISRMGIIIYLDENTRIEAYDENQPIKNCGHHISFMNSIPIVSRDKEILNILERVFGMKSSNDSKWLSGFDIETRKI